MIRIALFLAAWAAAAAVHAQALEGRLKRIAETKTIAIAYRADAIPFSYTERDQPTGFSIDLCKRVVDSIARQLKLQGILVSWVPVTVHSRFDAVARGSADMECGSSTITLSRLKQVDFSSPIFVESTGLLVKQASNVRSLTDLSGLKIAVVEGTTNERAVGVQVKRRSLSVDVLPFNSRDEALAALEAGKADAFASDKLLLMGAVTKAKDPRALSLLNDQLSFEPYGIVLPRNDAAFRLAVNTGLSQVFSSEEIVSIYRRWFGQLGPPSNVLEAAFILGAIPE
jgi:glutamate/aspartate transport system substrate-binding protein